MSTNLPQQWFDRAREDLQVARWNDLVRAVPEYDDCRRAAEEYHAPLLEVMAAAREAATNSSAC